MPLRVHKTDRQRNQLPPQRPQVREFWSYYKTRVFFIDPGKGSRGVDLIIYFPPPSFVVKTVTDSDDIDLIIAVLSLPPLSLLPSF